MKILENDSNPSVYFKNIKEKGFKISLIPTMGSIHEGHLSLIHKSKKFGFYTIVTIFVNPTQFDDTKDYDQYPRNRDVDINSLKLAGVDLLYFPLVKELYPEAIKSEKTIYEFRNILCDKFREGHFDGVTTVVKSLFNLICPDHVFFGEKDYQQLKLIKKIIEKDKLNISIYACKSIRMKNQMSFSSRYSNFISSQKIIFDQAADKILKGVFSLKKNINNNTIQKIKDDLKELNINEIDYLEVRDEINLLLTHENKNARLFVAFYIDNIRIIDNFILY